MDFSPANAASRVPRNKLAMRVFPGKSFAAMANGVSAHGTRDFRQIIAVWLLLALTLIFLALPNTSVPGAYYDEVHAAGLAKDFLTGHARLHMPGKMVISVFGRPFPVFLQNYDGAIKSWLLLPTFAVFGASQSVLRLTALGWALVALLLFMLWTWRWLGRNTAMLAAPLLAFDPTFFFINVLDWGPAFPSFLCRFACFYCALRWHEIRKDLDGNAKVRGLGYAFFAGLFAGLGFFNKIDFAVLLGSVLLALLCCHARPFWECFVLGRPAIGQPQWSRLGPSFLLAALGFFLSAGPMLVHIPWILIHENPGGLPGEPADKFAALLAMYDGSYFYRVMETGGSFATMHLTRPGVFMPFGLAFLLAAVYLIGAQRVKQFIQNPIQGVASFYRASGGTAAFLLLAIFFITLGVFLLQGAVKVHHMVLVYPLPHLVVALALARLLCQHRPAATGASASVVSHSRLLPSLVAVLFVLLLASEVLVLCRTQQFYRKTGGRGHWSSAVNAFARQIKNRSDLTVVSLDWGFNEQLAFLTDGPKLDEPFWTPFGGLDFSSGNTSNRIYLTHPPADKLFQNSDWKYLEAAYRDGFFCVDVRPWRDNQGCVSFFSFRLCRK
jgi:hypothetical protein